jgi:CHASE3 domain sensor protein
MTTRFQLLSRAVAAGLALMLVLLVGFTLWTGGTTVQAGEAAQSGFARSTVYDAVQAALLAESSAQYRYWVNRDTSALSKFTAACHALDTVLGRLTRSGETDDREMARTIGAEQRSYLLWSKRSFAAIDAGDLRQARSIGAHHVADTLHACILGTRAVLVGPSRLPASRG